jgi:hypothetical protein
MMKILPYEVVLWHRNVSSPLGVQEQIIALAGRSPDESNVMEDIRDMHWGFHSSDAATSFAESLFEVAASDNVVLLTVIAKRDDNFGRRIYKDARSTIQRTASE